MDSQAEFTNENDLVDDVDAPARHEAPLCAEAASIAKRIADLKSQLAAQEQVERDETARRKVVLIEGTEADVDACELAIDTSRGAQVRILERIELLAPQVAQANAKFRATELDAIAARADRARQLGEKLIRDEIAATLKQLAPQLERLAAYEQVIEVANNQLQRADRERVPSPNAFRCRPWRDFTETVKRTVGINEPGHPFYSEPYNSSLNGYSDKVTHSRTGESMPVYMEVEVTEKRTDRGDSPEALNFMVVPDIGPAHEGSLQALWAGKNGTVSQAVRDEVAAQVDKPNAKVSTAKRLLTALVAN